MPSALRHCRYCRKDFYSADFFTHLNSKHPKELWTPYNLQQIETATLRSARTHEIRLKIDGQHELYSPFKRRFYATANLYHQAKADLTSKELEDTWEAALKELTQPNPEPTLPPSAVPSPPPPLEELTTLYHRIYDLGFREGAAFANAKSNPSGGVECLTSPISAAEPSKKSEM